MPRFAHITDLHLRPPGVMTLGTVDTDNFAAEAINALVTQHHDIDAVIVSGDVADLGEEDAYARAAMLLSRFTVPVFVMPGNHDRYEPMRDAFATFPGVADAPVAGKMCYVREVSGVCVVVLDTLADGVAGLERGAGQLGGAQLAWLDATLAAADGPVLIAMHHPAFVTGIGFMDRIGLTDGKAFAAVLARHTNVVRIVCGHVHRVILQSVAGVPAFAIPGVAHQVELALSADAEPRLVMEPPAYGIHLVEDGEVVSHVAYVQPFGAPARFADLAAAAEPAR